MSHSKPFEVKDALPLASAVSVALISSYFLWKRFSNNDENEIRRTLLIRLNEKSEDERKLLGFAKQLEAEGKLQFEIGDSDEEGMFPLLLAVRDNKHHLVKYLLEKGSDDSIPNLNGWKAIHFACQNGEDGNVSFDHLISHRPSNAKEVNENTLWNCLHLAASKGNLYQVKKLLDLGVETDAKVDSGFTPLIIASGNGFPELVDIFLKYSPDLEAKATPLRKTALTFATLGGHLEIVKKLIEHGANVCTSTSSGNSPLYDASNVGNKKLVEYFLSLPQVDVNAAKTDGTKAIHAAASGGHLEIARMLLEKGATTEDRDNFGQTPLHISLWNTSMEMAKLLIEFGADVNAFDYDGGTPLHNLTRATIRGKVGASIEDQLSTAELLIKEGALVDGCKEDKCTALHVASCGGVKGIPMVKFLLENGADGLKETEMEWTPLHFACSDDGSPETERILREWISKKDPSFFDTFDKNKPKKEVKRRVKAPTLSEEERKAVLNGNVTLDGIADAISSGKIKKILVLTGAGISVSAGIPDFRSQDSGLYSAQAVSKYNLPAPSAAFDLNYLAQNPGPFYRICRDIFYPVKTGAIKPTPMHKFIRLLQDKGLLLKNYTQNIDMLEESAGIKSDMVIEAHGSFKSARCINCKYPADMDYFWNQISMSDVPICPKCHNTIRPDVTFFGEGMPSRFMDNHLEDLRQCDLLIIAGTSLVVYPFAGLVNQVAPNVPRLLFNNKAVGVFKSYEEDENLREGNYRDVAHIATCDEGALKLIEKLGWMSDYEKL
eukprot:TRINITY_DN558_c0_g1_i1.p1 TRINITY_DN558_c0_g1~~TRINITY_DN558_c0_g1_i1.p1  ORF type:complete len:777 (+),score=268.84 TRINITY_DN558_c0_g1_i1:131-2461(+)